MSPTIRKGLTALLLGLIVIGLLGTAAPAASQDGRGAIIEANWRGSTGIGSLNPLRCNNFACLRITNFLFPWLLGVDPVEGVFTMAANDAPLALAQSWDVSPDGAVYTFHLRDDLQWSDGVPITAYDVFYSYLAIASDEIDSPFTYMVNVLVRGAVPIDAQTIAFIYHFSTCSALDHTNIPVIPAHVFELDFAATAAAAFDGSGDLLAQFDRWMDAQAERSFDWMRTHPFDSEPPVTAGVFRVDTIQPTDYIRLVTPDGAQGYAFVDIPQNRNEIELFLAGETNFIQSPYRAYREDIRAADDVQIFEYPGLGWDYIGLNLSDPREPQSAFDEDGNRLNQGHHPIFGDVRVRRAMQMAIDVDALIEAALFGNGTVMPANQVPLSWAYDPDLTPVPYDPMGAARLLEEAGWRAVGSGGTRRCVGCLYAQEGEALSFNLTYSESAGPYRAIVAELIQQQLRQVGFSVDVTSASSDALFDRIMGQRYDAYLAGWGEPYPVDPDQAALFASAADVIGEGLNTGSYYNPRVDELMFQARTVPDCDIAARAGLYHEIQAILQEDQPFVWLFVHNDLIAARDGVLGFDPYPNAPFWNLRDWVIVR
jgi:peptide/nickel transport system substrate-binding protein